jgi:hypothetical protein
MDSTDAINRLQQQLHELGTA